MFKSNNELTQALKIYFLSQPIDHVCHALAGIMVDMNRIHMIDELDDEERDKLKWRIEQNSLTVQQFAKNEGMNVENMELINTETEK